jgi:hypothetical protein
MFREETQPLLAGRGATHASERPEEAIGPRGLGSAEEIQGLPLDPVNNPRTPPLDRTRGRCGGCCVRFPPWRCMVQPVVVRKMTEKNDARSVRALKVSAEIADLEARLAALNHERDQVQLRLDHLRAEFSASEFQSVADDEGLARAGLALSLTPAEKVALFRSLFCGRDDVYPKRWENPRYIGEGFDDARLDTLFLALPVSWKGTLVQYAGRLHRTHPDKREVRIFDYVDREVPMLMRMFDKRLRGYRAMGYESGSLPRGYQQPITEPVIEWDSEALPRPDDPA